MISRATGISGGIALALASSATFGTSGTLAHSLLAVGWTPAAAVTVRITLGALALTIPALLAARGHWADIRANVGMIAAFGVIAVAVCQLCYFNAVERMSVSIALLLEYMGIVLVVGWLWARHRQRPRRLTFAGTALAVGGLVLVLDVFGATSIDMIGVLWALGAAAGLAIYFVVGSSGAARVPPIVMAWGALVVGSATMWIFAAVGAVRIRTSTSDVVLAGHEVSWLVPVLGLGLLAAAFAYVAGIGAAGLLGPKLASFVSLTEVLFAVIFAWWFLGESLTPVQLVGAVIVIAGVTLVRLDEFRAPAVSSAASSETSSDASASAPEPALV